jgi:hypothetical protein
MLHVHQTPAQDSTHQQGTFRRLAAVDVQRQQNANMVPIAPATWQQMPSDWTAWRMSAHGMQTRRLT